MTTIKISDTRQPALTAAVLENIDIDQLPDVVRHGADCGFGNFVYYADTVAFYQKHKAMIDARAKELADELGEDALQMIASFGCLKGDELKPWDVAEALAGRGDEATNVQNAMAWFALEEIARELNPDL